MSSTPVRDRSWFAPAIALLAIVLGSLLVFAMLGSRVSGILSTVGASIGSPGGGQDVGSGDGTDGGDGNDSDSGTDGGDGNNSGSGNGTGGSGVGGGVIPGAPLAAPLIIKTGTLTLQVAEINAAVADATKQLAALGGYASSSDRAGTGEDAEATISFRLPAEQWDVGLNAVRGLADEVLAEQTRTEDVTSEVVDLRARIRNLQATEAALQAIMDRATLIEDVLAVQAELTTVRGKIEQLTAQQAHLEEQAAYSTLTVTFVSKPTPVLVVQQNQFDPTKEAERASARFVSILQRVAKAGIWFGIVWLPILVALAVGAVIAFVAIRWVRRRLLVGAVGS